MMPRFPWLFEEPQGQDPPVLSADGKALVAYLQRLGTTIGDWRERYWGTGGPAIASSAGVSSRMTKEVLAFGKQSMSDAVPGVMASRETARGRVPILNPQGPGFHRRHIQVQIDRLQGLAADGRDLYAGSLRARGTSMPSWVGISDRERWAVVLYIKTFSDRARKRPGQIDCHPSRAGSHTDIH